ncbi:MAG: hypothetical protein GY938_11945 [Ketobacter sp.]|nr:hypothetical protein [Ketobacter sp.]
MTEYLLVFGFLSMVILFAMMGSPFGSDEDQDEPDLSVISVLNDQQHEFARDIYQP